MAGYLGFDATDEKPFIFVSYNTDDQVRLSKIAKELPACPRSKSRKRSAKSAAGRVLLYQPRSKSEAPDRSRSTAEVPDRELPDRKLPDRTSSKLPKIIAGSHHRCSRHYTCFAGAVCGSSGRSGVHPEGLALFSS